MLQQLMTADQPAEQKIQRALEFGASYLDVDTGLVAQTFEEGATWKAIVSTTEDDSQFSEGTTLDLSNTYCRRVVEDDSSLKVHDATEQGLEDDPAYQIFNITSYFGTPLYEGDEISGTVCFVGQDSREPFDSEEALFLELLARFIENELVESQYETDLDESLEVVSALTRVLRHNIRNKLTVVRGYLHTQSQDSSEGLSSEVAIDAVDSVVNLSEEARKLEQILQESSDRRTVELTREIEQIVATIDDQVPTASITVDIPESLDYFARPTLPLALREIIENAAEHAGDTPQVTIKAAETDERVIISIQDDGPGLPEDEQTVITEGTETPLIHSSGLGHWIARTIVTKHDGDIETSVSDEGTTVTISLPRTTPSLPTGDSDDQLQSEYDKFRQAFDDAFETMLIIDDDGRIIENNERAAEIVGIEPQELVGRRVQEFIISDSEQIEIHDELLGEEQELIEITDTRGQTHVIEYSATPNVVPEQHLLVGRDVTDERNRQRELKQTKEQMEFALDATDTIVWEWNVDSDQATFYPSEAELYGTTVETREDFLEVVHPEDRQQVRESLQQALETGEAKHEEVRIQVNGEVRWIEAPGKPVVDTDGTTRMIGVVRDITDRKEREQELERMREFFREAEDLGNLGAWEFDVDGNHVWTEGTRRIHEVSEGFTPTVEQAIEFYHPEDRETIKQAVETALETGESFKHEVRLITAQDTQRWVRVRGEVLDNEELRTVRGFIQDITDHKEHEQELERTHELLEHTERIADVGSWEIDTDTMDVFWSENLFELLGIDADNEPPLDEALDVYHEDDRPVVESAVENALETGESFDVEVRFQRPNDEIRWFRIQGEPIVEDGEVVTLRGAVQDITEHKRREARLRETTSRLEALYHDSPDMIDVLAPDGTLIDVNQRFCEELGYDEDEVLGRPIWEIDQQVKEDDVAELLADFDLDEHRKFEGIYERRDGSTFPVEVHLLRLDLDGKNRFLAISRDITERKAYEQQLEQQNHN
jgi:PAS domain S-box-containing protein